MIEGAPVVARWKSAALIAPAIVSPPTTSPNAGRVAAARRAA